MIRVVPPLEKRRSDPRSDSGYANPGMRMEEGRGLGVNVLIVHFPYVLTKFRGTAELWTGRSLYNLSVRDRVILLTRN